jgi:hypothetical protein
LASLLGFVVLFFPKVELLAPRKTPYQEDQEHLISECSTPRKLPSPRLQSSSYPFTVGLLTRPMSAAVDLLEAWFLHH